MKHTGFQRISALFLILYTAVVLWYTVLSRPVDFYAVHTELFWSYRLWLGGDHRAGLAIVANIALFVPFGLLISACWRKPRVWKGLLAGLLLSCLVEGLQYTQMRGQFEWDDLLNNSLGALLGSAAFALLRGRLPEKALRRAAAALGALAILAAAWISLNSSSASPDYPARNYCFQVDSISFAGDRVELRGFGFRIGQKATAARLLAVCAETGERVPLEVRYGLERADVARYFGSEIYRQTGFTASGTGLDPAKEYRLCAAFGWPVPLATDVLFKGGSIRYAPEGLYRAPEEAGEELAALLSESVLRAYLPGLPCWVCQRGTTLYWVVQKRYPFESDGTTRFEYGLWSTQEDRLPQEKLHRELGCVDLSDYFEKHELEGDFGPYRVMARELPDEYPVTAVLTGYWSREGWSWQSCFRPIYVLD